LKWHPNLVYDEVGRVDHEEEEAMSGGGRARARGRALQRLGLVTGIAAVLALLLLLTGHWILAAVVAAVALVAGWLLMQARTVR
jgi:Flp pilus assembly protein TadB